MNCLNLFLFQQLNNLAGKNLFLDQTIKFLAIYLPVLFIVFLIIIFFRIKKLKAIIIFSLLSAIIGIFFNFLIHIFYFYPRPFVFGLGKQLLSHSADASFPSDHTTFMASIALFLLFFRKTAIIGGVLFLFALLGGLARVYCGIHFPFDIFGSILVSIIVSLISFWLYRKLLIKKIYGKK